METNLLENLLLVFIVVGWLTVAVLLIMWLIGKRKESAPVADKTVFTKPLPVIENVSKEKPSTPALVKSTDAVLLTIEVPKENDKTPQAAETLFASLHGIGEARLSFEIEAKEKSIRFYVWTPNHLRGYVESQLYAQYPNINIMEAKDYSMPGKIANNLSAVSTELIFKQKDFYPLKTFVNFTVDPLASITSTLSKLELGENVWVQIIVKPESDKWSKQALSFITAVREGRNVSLGKAVAKGLGSLAGEVLRSAMSGGTVAPTVANKGKAELPPGMDQVLKAVEEKSSKLGFKVKLRLVALDKTPEAAQAKLQLVIGAFQQFNTNNLNSFVADKFVTNTPEAIMRYNLRDMAGSSMIMNITELASVYHLPDQTVVTPNIMWAGSRKGEPPTNLPLEDEVPAAELTILAKTNFRGSDERFGIKLKDRNRHMYIIGKSGTGKSTLMENMSIDDVRERRGIAIIDPHGDYADKIIDYVPAYRVNDVIIFDPGDRDFPIAFNMLEISDPKYKVVVASGVVGIFKKIFGMSWGPRLEYWLSSAVLALLDYPDATLMMIPRLFTEDDFRNKVIDKIQDPLIKNRWINEYNRLDQKQKNETIGPILNKVGQFLSSTIIRNIVGQPKSSIDFRKLMDEGKILLVKLAKGIIGEDNTALLGAMIITQIQLAAMSRQDIDESKRRDFYLYVDEFQNFATESFQTIMSEARKYHLSLTLTNQYINQLQPEIRDAIFGNVSTIISFRVGGEDAAVLKKEFTPVFDETDLVNLNMFNIYIKLSIDGFTTKAFSAQTLPLPTDKNNNRDKIVKASRERYAKDVNFVQQKIEKVFEEVPAVPAGRPPVKAPFAPSSSAPAKPAFTPSANVEAPKPIQNRPVPFRPGWKQDKPISSAPTKPEPIKPSSPDNSLLKRVISAIEGKKQWTPPEKKTKPNLIAGLDDSKKNVEDARKRKADQIGQRPGETGGGDPLDMFDQDEQ